MNVSRNESVVGSDPGKPKPRKGSDVTGNAPDTLYVLLRDEEAAGKIIVELGAFVRFNHKIDKQLTRLERRTLKKIPLLLNRGIFGRQRRPS